MKGTKEMKKRFTAGLTLALFMAAFLAVCGCGEKEKSVTEAQNPDTAVQAEIQTEKVLEEPQEAEEIPEKEPLQEKEEIPASEPETETAAEEEAETQAEPKEEKIIEAAPETGEAPQPETKTTEGWEETNFFPAFLHSSLLLVAPAWAGSAGRPSWPANRGSACSSAAGRPGRCRSGRAPAAGRGGLPDRPSPGRPWPG